MAKSKKPKSCHVCNKYIDGKQHGSLCSNCNRVLGFFRHDEDKLKEAIKHLKQQHG